MPLGMEVDLSPGHIVLDGDPAPPPFRPMSVVDKRSPISAAAEHLFVLFAADVTVTFNACLSLYLCMHTGNSTSCLSCCVINVALFWLCVAGGD